MYVCMDTFLLYMCTDDMVGCLYLSPSTYKMHQQTISVSVYPKDCLDVVCVCVCVCVRECVHVKV